MALPIIVANWKMHLTLEAGLQLTADLIAHLSADISHQAKVVVCPPFIHLASMHALLTTKQAPLYLGAQNCHHEAAGAFTGEVSAGMLQAVGVHYVIIGHSERRQYFAEDPALLAAKINQVLRHGMTPIFCCGEDLATREKGEPIAFVTQQLADSLGHLSQTDISRVIIAYEPVWAIGTGKVPSISEIEAMHCAIRASLAQQYSDASVADIPILYGGSCNPANAAMLLQSPAIDGLLVGGASLQTDTFLPMIQTTHSTKNNHG